MLQSPDLSGVPHQRINQIRHLIDKIIRYRSGFFGAARLPILILDVLLRH